MTAKNSVSTSASPDTIEMLTIKDLQQIFKCSARYARELMHTAGFPSVIIGRKMYVEKTQLMNYLERHKGRKIDKCS